MRATVAVKTERASLFRTPSGSLAPRVGKPEVPEMRIFVQYDLGARYRPGEPVGTVTYNVSVGSRHMLAPGCGSALEKADGVTAQTPGKGRSKKPGATVFNQCS